MKNRILLFALPFVLLFVCGCAATNAVPAADQTENVPSPQTEDPAAGITEPFPEPADDVLDLTSAGQTVAYAQLYAVAMEPDAYVGKTIRLTGVYRHVGGDADGGSFDSCVVTDATACCAQGLDFRIRDGLRPALEALVQEQSVTVEGVFTKGELDGMPYYYLADAQLLA